MARMFALVLCVAAFLVPLAARAADTAPTPPSALSMVHDKLAAGDAAGAITDLAAYVPGHPADIAAARLLGDLYFRQRDYRHAEATWKALVAKAPGDTESHNRLGRLYAVQDRIDDAIAEFSKSLPSAAGFAGYVEAHRKRGDLAQVAIDYARGAAEHPFDPIAQSSYGSVLRAMRDYDRAQIYFERTASLDPKNCGALTDAGNNLIDLGRIPDALRWLHRCLTIDPADYAANIDTGEAYLQRDDKDAARAAFDRALATKPNGSEALVDIGYLEDERGRWQTAVEDYQRAIDADPLEAAAYVDLGFDFVNHAMYTAAEAACIKGLSIAIDDGRLHFVLAVAYHMQGKVELARAQYRLAMTSHEPAVVRAAQSELTELPQATLPLPQTN